MKTKLFLLLFCGALLFLATGCYSYHGHGYSHPYYRGSIHFGYYDGFHHFKPHYHGHHFRHYHHFHH